MARQIVVASFNNDSDALSIPAYAATVEEIGETRTGETAGGWDRSKEGDWQAG